MPAGWSLRRRLLVTTVGLIAAVSLVVGVVSVLVLQAFLTDRLDQQLQSAFGRSASAVIRSDPGGDPRALVRTTPEFLDAPGQGQDTLGALFYRGALVRGGVIADDGAVMSLSDHSETVLGTLPVDGRPHTRDLGGDLDGYRLIATVQPSGEILVTGLPMDEVQRTVYRLALVISVVAALGLALAAATGAALINLALQPLRRVASTAAQVSELPLDRGEVDLTMRVPDADTDPSTEAGRVGAAVNRLLDHVSAALTARQASESRVRRFVADASHELRTPLTSIRGYAELTRRHGGQLPPDVSRAVDRIESESVRMSALVEDLLLLARLDEGRPLEREPVDLTALVVDAVGDARAAGPEHAWRLETPVDPVVVTGDGGRLHQVVANLLTNARVHTPEGTHVTARLGAAAGRAVLEVIDDGPGIDPALLPDVFERFARGDTSRSRQAGSTGLGLALVHAVVEAHGGTVTVDSEPGRTCFRVELPLAPAAPPAG